MPSDTWLPIYDSTAAKVDWRSAVLPEASFRVAVRRS